MASPLSLQTQHSIVLNSQETKHSEMFELQFADAQRELEAFVMAAAELFGKMEAASAAEYWIQLAESMEAPLVDGYPNWRHITIAAASQLARECAR